MLRPGLMALTAVALPVMAMAEDYRPPAPGTKFLYGHYEGGETPNISHSVTVLAGDNTGFVGQVDYADGGSQMLRYLYGFTSYHCDEGYHVFGEGLGAIWPLAPGNGDTDGAFFVIGKDMEAWVNGTGYDTWAVREITEHGTTWVTRFSPALGIGVDELVGMETGASAMVDLGAVQRCLAGENL